METMRPGPLATGCGATPHSVRCPKGSELAPPCCPPGQLECGELARLWPHALPAPG